MTKTLFVTATGTDIGKTYVSALIVKKMRDAGYNCGYFKPVLSGVEETDGKLTKSDCNYVVETANIPTTADDCVGYWWKEAVSPHLASQRIRERIDVNRITKKYEDLLSQYDYLLIEGAGGITCPLILDDKTQYLMKDLIKDLGSNVVIVADAGLGTINYALLTYEYAKQNNINVEGFILNNYEESNFMHRDNLIQVENLTNKPVLATVQKGGNDIKLLKDMFTERNDK